MKSDAPLSPSPSPAIAGHQYVAASRPVVGTVAACSLLLFVCSWFAIGKGSLWPTRDVGTPDPVRIDAPKSPQAAAPAGIRAPHGGAAHTVATPSRHELLGQRGTSAKPTAPARIAPEGAAAQKPAPAATAATQPPAPSATPAAPAADQPRVVFETPQLAAPLDGLPEVSVTVPVPQLPSVSLPVTPPSVPKVPVVSDVTASVGLP
jgi:hypothetical protein